MKGARGFLVVFIDPVLPYRAREQTSPRTSRASGAVTENVGAFVLVNIRSGRFASVNGLL